MKRVFDLLSLLAVGVLLLGAAPARADTVASDYPPVVEGRTLAFPRDYGAHPRARRAGRTGVARRTGGADAG